MRQLLTYLMREIDAQRDRWIFWVPVPVALGIIWYFSLHAEPPLYAGFAGLGVAGVLFALFRHRTAWLLPWLFFALFVLGFTAAQVRTWSVDAPVLSRETYPMTVSGRVVEVDALPKAYRIILDDMAVVEGKYFKDTLPERVRIRLKNADPTLPRAGDRVEIRAVLLPLSGPVMPDAFDFQRHAFFKRLGATGYAVGDLRVTVPDSDGFFFEKLRHYIRTHVEAHVKDRDNAAITTALMVGESKGISEPAWDVIRDSGIAHLIAISGFHITLVAGFMFFLVRALLAAIPYIALRWPVKKIAAVAAVGGVIFYMLLIASPIPAQRAVIMTCVVMGAVMLDRDPFTLRLASFAALVIFLLQPESVVGPSFQLSFSAVVAMIAFYEATRQWWTDQVQGRPWYRRYAIYLLGCFVTTVIASLATAPYALYHFSRMPTLSGLVANMIAVPVSSFWTMPAGVVACFLMPLGLEKWPLWLTEKSVEVIMWTARETAAWPHAVVQVDAWPSVWLGFFAFGGIWICFWRGRIRWLGLVPFVAALCALPFAPRADILVADSGKIFAVRGVDDGGKLWASSKRRERFIRNAWVEREGGHGHDVWPQEGSNGFIACGDDGACVYTAQGRRVSFALQEEQVDCSADIVVIARYMDGRQACAGKVQIDRNILRRHGAQAVYFEDGGRNRIVTVAETRGVRPWTGRAVEWRRKYVP
jgi:competence protein ComEC